MLRKSDLAEGFPRDTAHSTIGPNEHFVWQSHLVRTRSFHLPVNLNLQELTGEVVHSGFPVAVGAVAPADNVHLSA
jgi:hypothetical protein